MPEDQYNLNRFVEAQARDYAAARSELQAGQKRSHWMWYIFPQLKNLGRSSTSQFYGISGIAEAEVYLLHPLLCQHLREISEVILSLPTNNAVAVFGGIDSCKLCSSMTLFDLVSPNDIFACVLDKYFQGCRDGRTLRLIKQAE